MNGRAAWRPIVQRIMSVLPGRKEASFIEGDFIRQALVVVPEKFQRLGKVAIALASQIIESMRAPKSVVSGEAQLAIKRFPRFDIPHYRSRKPIRTFAIPGSAQELRDSQQDIYWVCRRRGAIHHPLPLRALPTVALSTWCLRAIARSVSPAARSARIASLRSSFCSPNAFGI
jgi:hypothetical protein